MTPTKTPSWTKLSRGYTALHGAPTIKLVDPAIFTRTYFAKCMECSFCHDVCCSYGVDVDLANVARILDHAEQLEPLVGEDRSRWFTSDVTHDAEFPGGQSVRTTTKNGRCVFLNNNGRGCLIHSYAISAGIDFHELKPMVSTLFPLTFDDDLLHPSNEIEDSSLCCLGPGQSLYQAVRSDLVYYFGNSFVFELDALEASTLGRVPA